MADGSIDRPNGVGRRLPPPPPRAPINTKPAQHRSVPPPLPPEALSTGDLLDWLAQGLPVEIHPDDVTEIIPIVLAAGKKIGNYELVRKLGIGGCAEVWEAKNIETDEPVAIKINIRKDDKHLFREQGVLEGLAGKKGTVRLIEGMAEDGYIVMELVKGRSLDSLLAQRPALEDRINYQRYTARCLAAVARVLHILQDIHSGQNGIVHGDLSLDNIFLRENAKGEGEVVIIDWGIAYGLNETPPSKIDGKLQYLAPERLMEMKIDPRSDIYALGCMLYTLLLNIPFPEEDAIAEQNLQEAVKLVTMKRVLGQAFSLKEYQIREQLRLGMGNEVADSVTNLLIKMTTGKLKNRFADALEAAQAVEPIITHLFRQTAKIT